MEAPVLSDEEMAALRTSMAEAQKVRDRAPTTTDEKQAAPVALISDDRAAEAVRPNGLRLAQSFATAAQSRIARLSGVKLEIDNVTCEIVDGNSVREHLAGTWMDAVAISGRSGQLFVSAGGPMVEDLAVRRLGGAANSNISTKRPPSATALKLFASIGEGIVGALAATLRDQQGCEAKRDTKADAVELLRRQLVTSEVVVLMTVAYGPALAGRLRVMAHPETLLPKPPPPVVMPAPAGAIEQILGATPVLVSVLLGSAAVSVTELGALKIGSVVSLQQACDGLLPVRCGGVVKAHGRPLVVGGALAVEIVTPSTSSTNPGNQK